jgi:hypothetical protein
MRSVMSALLLAVVAAGCGSDIVGPGTVDGIWSEDVSIPGNFVTMTLVSTQSTVTGNGNWCGEAGPCGVLEVAGTVNGNAVQLDLSFIVQTPGGSSTTVRHFDGGLTLGGLLAGTLTSEIAGQPPAHVTFRRPASDPPNVL